MRFQNRTLAAFSILATKFSDDRIIMAADSRATDAKGHRIDDLECKIRVIDTNLVFVAGAKANVSINNKTFLDADQIAVSVRQGNSTANIKTVATLWGQEMKSAFEKLGKLNRAGLLSMLEKNQAVALGVFAGTESDGHISVYFVEMGYDIVDGNIVFPTTVTPIEHGTGSFFFHGSAAFMEFVSGNTKRAQERRIRLAWELASKHVKDVEPAYLIAGVQAAIDWSNDEAIGGDVDALVLHKGGKIEWLQKKKTCYQPPK